GGAGPIDPATGRVETYLKSTSVASSSMTFIFVEQADWRGYNVGTWVVRWNVAAGRFSFDDPVAMYHGNVSTFAFADGHAEYHRWTHSTIISAGKLAASGAPNANTANSVMASISPATAAGADYDYVHDRYRFGT